MTERGLRIALLISVLVNGFLLTGAMAAAMLYSKALNEKADQRQHTPLAAAAQELAPPERARIKDAMRAVALHAKPDFDVARAARRHAADLAAAPTFDRDAIAADLIKARAAEEQGRAKLESGLLDFMQKQTPASRAILAKVLRGRTPMRLRGPGDPPQGPPPGVDGQAPPR
jgi:uncharacterized membrane protein